MLNINKIEKYRKKAGFTIVQLVEKLDITDTTYNNLKKTRDFRISTIEKMAMLFNVDIRDFFDENNYESEKTEINLANKKQNNYSSLNENTLLLNIANKLDRIIELMENK